MATVRKLIVFNFEASTGRFWATVCHVTDGDDVKRRFEEKNTGREHIDHTTLEHARQDKVNYTSSTGRVFENHEFARWWLESHGWDTRAFLGEAKPVPKPPTIGPRKPPPAIPPEVHNERAIDKALAMQAVRDLCRGTR